MTDISEHLCTEHGDARLCVRNASGLTLLGIQNAKRGRCQVDGLLQNDRRDPEKIADCFQIGAEMCEENDGRIIIAARFLFIGKIIGILAMIAIFGKNVVQTAAEREDGFFIFRSLSKNCGCSVQYCGMKSQGTCRFPVVGSMMA